MRHLHRKAHLNRSKSHRKAVFNNLSTALFLHKKIVTTLGKARYARRHAERMITFARRGDLAARRQIMRFIHSKEAVNILFDELGPHFKNRDGGYSRIIKLGTRRGDNAPMALIELVGFGDVEAVSTDQSKTDTKSKLRASQKKAVEEKVEDFGATAEAEKNSSDGDSEQEVAAEVKEETASENETDTKSDDAGEKEAKPVADDASETKSESSEEPPKEDSEDDKKKEANE